jgi:glutamate/aspartate transport system substrate-binding protein
MKAPRIACVALIFSLLAQTVPVLAGTLDDIKSSGELRLAFRADTPPFSSRGKDSMPEGFTIDLCRIIAADIRKHLDKPDLKVTWVEVSAEGRFDAIVTGRAHLECGSTTVTLSRQEQVDFSNLTYVTGASLMHWSGTDINRVDDLGKKRVSVVSGTTTEKVLRDTLAAKNIDAKVVVVKNHAEAVQLLVDHKIDAMAGDRATLFGIGFKTQADNNFVLTEDMMSFEPYALPLRRNDADFRLVVNRSLSNLYTRGDVGRSWQQWFGQHNVRATSLLLMLYRLNSFAE